MTIKIFIILFTSCVVLQAETMASGPALEAKVKTLLLEIDFSRDGQREPRSITARTELGAMNRGDAVDALVALHNKSDFTGSTAGDAMRSSGLRASVIRMLDLWGEGATKALDLARTDFDSIARQLLSRKETDDLRVSPFEIESVLKILVYHGTSQDIESIKSASKALSKHKTTLSGIWAQSIQSDLEMLEKERQLDQVSDASKQPRGSETILNLPHDAKVSNKSSNSALPPPSGEPTASTPWTVVVVLIVATIGLLWLLFKKQK